MLLQHAARVDKVGKKRASDIKTYDAIDNRAFIASRAASNTPSERRTLFINQKRRILSSRRLSDHLLVLGKQKAKQAPWPPVSTHIFPP